MNKKIVKDAMILFAFTVVLGLLLGIVNEITKEPIAKVNYEIEQNAYREVFKDGDSLEAVESFTAKDAAKIIAKSEYTADEITDVNAAKDKDGNILGYVINVTSHEGSQADISLSVGIRMDGTLNGYSITSISETPGLGMLVKEKPFYSQFENKAEESYNVVKSTPAADNEIESVTGATISSRAVTNAVSASLLYFRTALQGGN